MKRRADFIMTRLEPKVSKCDKKDYELTCEGTPIPKRLNNFGKIIKPTLEYRWCLDKFLEVAGERSETTLFSPTFMTDEQLKWKLKMKLYPSDEKHKPHIGLFLTTNNSVSITTNFEFTIIINNNIIISKKSIDRLFKASVAESIGFTQLIQTQTILDKLEKSINKSLVVSCKITNTKKTTGTCNNFKESFHKLSNNFENLLATGLYSDVTLVAQEKEFKAHKSILVSRSSYFAAMFAHNTTENLKNVVEIKNIEPDILYEILRYLYCCRINNIDDLVQNILIAANMFGIDDLQDRCLEHINMNIDSENCIDLIKFSDTHNFQSLRTNIIHYMLKNSEVINKPDFGTIEKKTIVEILKSAMIPKMDKLSNEVTID